MASLFYRQSFAALTAVLAAAALAPEALAQPGGGADQPVATNPAAAQPVRPLDDDRYIPPPVSTPGQSVTPPSVAPVNQPPAGSPAPQPRPVGASALPAVVTPPVATPPVASAPPPVAARPVREEPAKPEYKTTVEGKVTNTPGKSLPIKVGKGDTVNVISDRLATPKDDLIKLNKLKKPYELDLGQILQIPTPKAYSVESGDTLYSIGKRFGLTADVLSEINDLDPEDHLRAGRKIYLPSDIHDGGPIKILIGPPAPPRRHGRYGQPRQFEPIQGEAVPPPEEGGGAPVQSPPSRIGPPPPSSYGPPVVEAAPAPSDSVIMAAGKGRFAWPVSGTILSTFGAKPGGQRNDGVDIATTMGAPVMAAAEGDVVYAGNQVPGFGNLVLIKHADGWVTAYAHLSRTEVKIKDHVEEGQEIGLSGQTGGVDQPQLHFEIRYAPSPRDKARPIDPSLVLPPR